MNLELKGFQDIAKAELLTHVRAARQDAPKFDQAVLLSAPTGAGKTVIATAVIEGLLIGDDEAEGYPDTTILWLTDQPELNEQTKRRMRLASSMLDDSRLVTIETTFQDSALKPGRVYFLNTQKLGKNSTLVNRGDGGPSIWQVLRESIVARPQDFLVIIDEAHRGMTETVKDRELAQSIVQKFIKGSDADDLPPVPMIFGISATPRRFLAMVAGKRNLRPQVEVLAEDVRASGLLKQTLLVYHPAKHEPSDYTLLRAAAERANNYREAWEDYGARTQSTEEVEPLLVVQVENAPKSQRAGVTQTDLALALSVIEETLGQLDETAMAHCFQEELATPVGDGRVLRHIQASDIQDDPALRVVFFKTALTTGWDCPRAEVIMSFRKAVDHTNIAQLVGRMVRTPLARTIEDDEFLNTVSLYLPHYDKAGLDKVLGRLQQDDPEYIPPIDVQPGNERVRLNRDPSKSDCFKALAGLPTYDVVRVRTTSNLRRAVKLARLLDQDTVTTGGLDEILKHLVDILESARAELEQADWWSNVVKDAGTIDLRTVEWALGLGAVSEHQSLVPITQKNVDDLFAAAGRRLGEGVHKAYWRRRSEEDKSERIVHRIAKLEIFALSQHAETTDRLEEYAKSAIAEMQAEHGAAIEALPPDRKEGYRQVRLTAKDLQSRPLGIFEHIEGDATGTEWKDHLYVSDDGTFRYKFRSSWEPMVLEEARSEKGFVGWLRVVDRKDWALAIPYRMGSEIKPLYPDFLVFRKGKGRVVVDLIDPHDPTRDDWLPKVKGLAEYAAKHWAAFGRIEASFVDKKVIHRLDLRVEQNRVAAMKAEGPNGLRALFTAKAPLAR